MPKDDRRRDVRSPKNRLLLVIVGLGIVFFISGFVLTVTSLSEPDTASADSDLFHPSESGERDTSISLLLGLLLSLAGVVMATAGPAMFFIHASKSSH